MNRIIVAVLFAFAVIPTCASQPQIPRGLGYCVSAYAADGTFLGSESVPLHKPSPEKLEEFRASVMSALNYIGHRERRLDLVAASGTVIFTEDPTSIDLPGCVSACGCASPLYCSSTAAVPMSAGARKPPGDGGGRAICGCGGACGSCEKCVVICNGQ